MAIDFKPFAWLAAAAVAAGAIIGRSPDFALATPPVAAAPAGTKPADGTSVSIPAGANGQFRTIVSINGVDVPMVVDTGATYVTLRAADAARAGLVVDEGRFTSNVSTANGFAALAPIEIGSVRVGAIARANVKALVARPGALGVSLLGMSFLRRLSKTSTSSGVLELTD